MEIIRLPLKNKVDTVPDVNHRLFVGPIGFTCPSCGTRSEVNFSKMVFRSVDFYCGSCGHYYKLTNPAFGHTPKKR